MTGCFPRTSALYILGIPPVIFYQLAAPEILFRMGDDSWKGTPFFACFMNWMQFRYMKSLAYFSIKLSYNMRHTVHC